MPNEPPDSSFKTRIKTAAYPDGERGGIVWTYMGPAAHMPPAPDWELTRTPASHRFVSKTIQDCNWLQTLEGGLDLAHAMIMHVGNVGDLTWLDDYERTTPKLEVKPTDYGFYYTGIRAQGERRWVRLYQYFMPFWQMRGRVAPIRARRRRRRSRPCADMPGCRPTTSPRRYSISSTQPTPTSRCRWNSRSKTRLMMVVDPISCFPMVA